MNRGLCSIILLVILGVLQGVSLCHCRAAQLLADPSCHVPSGGDAADGDSLCAGDEACSSRFCDLHLQSKRSSDSAVAVVADLAPVAVVSWAEPQVHGSFPHPTEAPSGASSLNARITPLLI